MGSVSSERVRTADLGLPVSYYDFGGEGRPIVLVHGLGGSYENWMAVGPELARGARVLAPDLAGFGRTPRNDRKTSAVNSNRALLDDFLNEVVGEGAVLVGNSMGGMISIFQAAAEPQSVEALVLIDAVMPHPPGTPIDPVVFLVFSTYMSPEAHDIVSAAAADLGPETMVRNTMDLCCVDAGRVPSGIMDAHIDLARERGGMEWAIGAQIEAARSILEVTADPDAYYEVIRSVTAPTLMINGECDRLVPLAAARAAADLRPDWSFEVLEGIGHVPHLEAPELVVRTIEKWLVHAPREMA